jgi:hypothetical protein
MVMGKIRPKSSSAALEDAHLRERRAHERKTAGFPLMNSGADDGASFGCAQDKLLALHF